MNVPAGDANVFMSRNGQYIATNLVDSNNVDQGSFRWDAKSGWIPVISNVGSCGTDKTYTWGITDDGSVYGMAYKTCESYQGFRWNPSTGMNLLPTATKKDDGTPSNSRPNRVSADGSTIVGWEETLTQVTQSPEFGGQTDQWIDRVASYTHNGQPNIVRNSINDTMDEASAVSSDGKVIGGFQFDGQAPVSAGWFKTTDASDLSYLTPINGTSRTTPLAMSKDGSLMVGFAGNQWFDFTPGPFLYSSQMGMLDMNKFLALQGANMEALAQNAWTPMAMSEDGSVIGGWSSGNLGYFGWVIQMPKALVCHRAPGNLAVAHTISVPFPKGLDQHLAMGDTLGPCQDYQQ